MPRTLRRIGGSWDGIRRKDELVQSARFSTSFRIVSYVILLLMAASIVYGGAIVVMHWSGISV